MYTRKYMVALGASVLVLIVFLGTFLLCIILGVSKRRWCICCGYPFVPQYQPQAHRDRRRRRQGMGRQEQQVDEIELAGRGLPAYEAKETQLPKYSQEAAPKSERGNENKGNTVGEAVGEEEH